jgi:tetratricopeptide (TPR) repeat protein
VSSAAQTSVQKRQAEAEKVFQAAKQAQEKGDFGGAVAGYQAALKLVPDPPEIYSNMGLAYYYQKDYEKAIEAFQHALKRKPDLFAPNLFLGMAYVRTNQSEKSIQPLIKAISLDPKVPQAYINLSGSFQALGKDEEAVQVLQQAAKLFPDDPEVLYCLGSLHYQLMFKAYGQMAKVAPNSYRYNQVLGQSFQERMEYPAAIVQFQKAIDENHQAPGLHYSLANVYWLQGLYAKAKPEFEAELELSPEDYRATWKLGNIYLQNREYDKALPLLEKALQQKADLGGALQDLGKLYLQTNDTERALFYLKKVIELSPDEPTSHYLLSMTYRRIGDSAAARSEMLLFEKLRKAQGERRLPPEAMFAGTNDKGTEPPPADSPDAEKGPD